MKKIILTALGLLLIGCSENSTTESTKQVVQTKKVVVEKKVKEKILTKKEVVKEKPKVQIVKSSIKTGREIFMTCAACHGSTAQKVALGKSKIIKGWKSSKIQAALNGYKDGSYGGTMKGLMKGQVASLSDEDIISVANYISKL